ncbi:MAG: hypothetical protein JF606_23225 [Burkholderiales bacterium]|nr:hypothetical protein [Burkholderiales bacterium]
MQPPATPGYWGGDFFDAGAYLPPVAESHDRHIPRFDASDTGGHWEHRHEPQSAPSWLLGRGLYPGQIIEIHGEQYRVVQYGQQFYVTLRPRGG